MIPWNVGYSGGMARQEFYQEFPVRPSSSPIPHPQQEFYQEFPVEVPRTRQLPPPQRTASGSQVGYAAGQTASRVAAGIGAYAGAKAGQAHYERTGDLSESLWLGAIAGRRWFVWLLACGAWTIMCLITFSIFMGVGVDYQDYEEFRSPETFAAYQESRGMFFSWFLSLPVMVMFLLALYKRNIDFGLHRRNTIYGFARVVGSPLTWAPNWLLYLGFIIVPVSLQFIL